MVGWGGIQGGRFTSIVRAHKLHKETIVSAKGKKEQGWKKKNLFKTKPTAREIKLLSARNKKVQTAFECGRGRETLETESKESAFNNRLLQ